MAALQTVLGISLLIVLHELGHFLVARWCGMRVLRFSIGFGPAILQRKFGETTWQLAAVPLGGFVQVDGMGPREADAFENDARNFRNRPRWQRAAVIGAGPAMNWLLAAVFLALLAGTVGMTRPDESRAVVGELVPGEAAEDAGLLAGDRVLSIDGQPLDNWNSLVERVRAAPEKALMFVVQREEHELGISVTPRRAKDGDYGVLGIYPAVLRERSGPLSALLLGASGAWDMTARQASLLWGMVSGTQEGRLSGLPGMFKMVSEQARRGLERLFQTLAWLSVTLCLLNLLPVPALDGSRLAFIAVEAVRRKPLNERVEAIIHTVGFVLLLALMLVVSVRDLL